MACIADEGLEKTTMRNVAQRAGVSTGTLAYYFKSKKDLIDAALLDASERFMQRFNNTQRMPGPAALDQIIERFLSPNNADAAFVLQMIEVGLHNSELRGTHLDLIRAGRKLIADCIRVGLETGHYRAGLDPDLVAALVHGVLIWWGSELVWNATSRGLATNVTRLLLQLLEMPPEREDSASERAPPRGTAFATTDRIRSVLLADPGLTREKADALAHAVEQMYLVATPDLANTKA